MNPLHERYPDVLGERPDDPRLERCVADLDATCAALTMPARRDATFARALYAMARERRVAPQVRRRLPYVRRAAAVLVLLTGGVGYLRLQSPTSVSAAQATLNRAVTTLRATAANRALHAVYTVTATGTTATPPTTIDEWTLGDATGAIAKATLAFSDGAGHLESRTVLTGDAATTYNVGANSVMTGTVDRSALPTPLDAAALAQVVQQAQQNGQDARLLPADTLDGATVQVVEIDRTSDDTARPHQIIKLYIDAHTSIVRGLDFATTDAAGAVLSTTTLRLATFEAVDPSVVPANTFTLRAPASARVILTQAGPQRMSVAQAMAVQAMSPVPLLVGSRVALRDVQVGYLADGMAVGYLYGPDTHFLGVYVVTNRFGAVQRTDPLMRWPGGAGHPLTLTIAGQRVHAAYYQLATHTYMILYLQAGSGVRIVGSGTSQVDFFDQVHALVDGRTHPIAVAQAQHDLTLARTSGNTIR